MNEVLTAGATITGVMHHRFDSGGVALHYVTAGTDGSPVLLVHGWPETWWAFHALIPLLAASHRVCAVDLRGFGDSEVTGDEFGVANSVEDLHRLVEHLGLGPVHVLCQDISGGIGFAFAATHGDNVRSLTAVESALSGFGLEGFADVGHGGSWHVGFLATPGVPELLLAGHERDLLAVWAYPAMTSPGWVPSAEDLDELTRTFARPGGWRGTAGLYREIFTSGGRNRELAASRSLAAPVLTVDAGGAALTEQTFRQVAAGEVRSVQLDGVGHLVAQEAPQLLAPELLSFWADCDAV